MTAAAATKALAGASDPEVLWRLTAVRRRAVVRQIDALAAGEYPGPWQTDWVVWNRWFTPATPPDPPEFHYDPYRHGRDHVRAQLIKYLYRTNDWATVRRIIGDAKCQPW